MRPARFLSLGASLLMAACGSSSTGPAPAPTPCPPATSPYAQSVAESWIPSRSLAQNIYNDPQQALGAPNVGGFGPNNYTGFVSLGFGGHVTVDFGGCITDQPGNDIRVYQAVSNEPVSVYVATSPDGPFTLLLPFFKDCPSQAADHLPGNRNAGFCDFDLASAGVTEARYVRVEDAELYPTPGDTHSEGADLDAVQALAVRAVRQSSRPEPVLAEQVHGGGLPNLGGPAQGRIPSIEIRRRSPPA